MRKLRSPKVRARRVLWLVSLTQPRTHTHSETRRHFPVQLSSLNVMCCCLLFNLGFTMHRMCHVAELILWLENSFLAFFFTFGLFLLISFWPGFSDKFYIFILIICRRIEWLECLPACPPWDQQEAILLSNPPQLLLPAELAAWVWLRLFSPSIAG